MDYWDTNALKHFRKIRIKSDDTIIKKGKIKI